ncbi:hypothetical protein TELCIR_10161 [Teladorsagia circumcincta]|uniref:Phospholipid scramblase n=1 Tax=Teladorsagia circumcincta TaxID=45464 RepID=A0A2G9UCV3_TELCI|nr:hypothetical protein TELCIR_10161 [Teladorsagia circumcincta]
MTRTLTTQPGTEAPREPKGSPVIDTQRLQCLKTTDKLVLRKIFKSDNRYDVWNATGSMRIFYAIEESVPCEACCCGRHRGFTVHIMDNLEQVTKPSGKRIGGIEKRYGWCMSNMEYIVKCEFFWLNNLFKQVQGKQPTS